MPSHKSSKRKIRDAFTLVELLVVIGIIGMLVGLLLPAVQAAREYARRMQCGNQLRQTGLAIANYHSAFDQLPRAWWLETPPKAFNGKPWGVAILPFIEQQSLYESLDHSALSADQTSPRNVAVLQTPIVNYMCPSAPGNASERKYRFNAFAAGLPFTVADLAPIDYTPSTGVRGLYAQHAYGTNLTNSREGAMQVVSAVFGGSQDGDFAGILDGLSNTFLMGERTGGPTVYSRGRIDPVANAALIGLEGGEQLKVKSSNSKFSPARPSRVSTTNGTSPLVKVHGIVIVDGEVAEGVVLALHPQPTGPALSTGISQSDGTFQISTYETGDGAPVGSYQVTCVWSKFNPVTRGQEGGLLSGLYASAETTTIHFDIVEGESHDA